MPRGRTATARRKNVTHQGSAAAGTAAGDGDIREHGASAGKAWPCSRAEVTGYVTWC